MYTIAIAWIREDATTHMQTIVIVAMHSRGIALHMQTIAISVQIVPNGITTFLFDRHIITYHSGNRHTAAWQMNLIAIIS
jgi:hypothetical protein